MAPPGALPFASRADASRARSPRFAAHAAAALLSALATAPSHAGLVTFTQTSPGPIWNDSALGPTTATFDVVFESSTDLEDTGFREITLTLASEDLTFTRFVLDAKFESMLSLYDLVLSGEGTAPSEMFLDALTVYELIAIPRRLGELSIDANGLAVGTYEITVVENLESRAFGPVGERENLYGSISIAVIPEPATVLLLAGGATVHLSRRRRRLSEVGEA